MDHTDNTFAKLDRLDAITNEQVQKVKLALADRAPKTVNNVLTVLSTLLKKAVEWGELEKLPCTVKLSPNPKKAMGFHDFDEYERLLAAAQPSERARRPWSRQASRAARDPCVAGRARSAAG